MRSRAIIGRMISAISAKSVILATGLSLLPLGAQERHSVSISSPNSPQIQKARIITENEEAYRSKIDVILSAKESLKLMYYIYSDDETSSYLTQRLIEKARNENVKVDLLVDFHTNFVRWDLFKYMEQEGRGNLRVRFFNRPNPSLIRDVTFMTATCRADVPEAQCRAERKQQADQALQEAQSAQREGRPARLPVLTSAMLAGIYSKSATTLKTALALGSGKDLQDVQKLLAESKSQEKMTDAEFDQLKQLLVLIRDAKLKGSVAAKIQLGLAMAAHGDKIQPIMDMIDKVIPDTMKDELADNDSWVHLTDFLHHKFLLADGIKLQMGGRNVENSYHVNAKVKASDKYIFRDTDLQLTLNGPNSELGRSFDRLFNAKSMVAGTADIETEMNFEFVADPNLLGATLMGCMRSQPQAIGECVERSGGIRGEQTSRLPVVAKNLEARASSAVMRKILLSRPQQENQFVENELSPDESLRTQITYLENLPYAGTGPELPSKRLYFQKGSEAESRRAKAIHLAVESGIEGVCQEAARDYAAIKPPKRDSYLQDSKNWRRIVFHQGYVIFPGEILRAIGRSVSTAAVNGGRDARKCPAVRFEILTNSVPTTDLSVINLFAGMQIGALLEEQQKAESYFNSVQDPIVKSRLVPPAQIAYYELQAPADEALAAGATHESLHTKVYVLGRESFVLGSANADVRSYYMDTNNAVEVRGAPQWTKAYLNWVDSQKQPQADRAFFAEVTPYVRAGVQAVSSISAGSQSETTKKRREFLKGVYQAELGKVVAGFEKKWRANIKDGDREAQAALDARLAKIQKYLPTAADIIAGINLNMYGLSRKIIGLDDATTDEITKAMAQLNLQFELL